MKTYRALVLLVRDPMIFIQPGETFEADEAAGEALVNAGMAEEVMQEE